MKDTAVKFLIDEISCRFIISEELRIAMYKSIEMEKEQHEETFKQSRLAKIFEKDMPPVWNSWEQYYTETFKSE